MRPTKGDERWEAVLRPFSPSVQRAVSPRVLGSMKRRKMPMAEAS